LDEREGRALLVREVDRMATRAEIEELRVAHRRGRALPVEAAESARVRFEAKVDRSGPGECWTWTGYRDRDGYGSIRIGARCGQTLAHRVAWVLANREPIPEGKVIRHECDYPPCVNPAHLLIGTDADNWRDAIERGRARFGFVPGHTLSRRTACRRGHDLTGTAARTKPFRGNPLGQCRECLRLHARDRVRNREAMNAYNRAYYARNRDAVNARNRARRRTSQERAA